MTEEDVAVALGELKLRVSVTERGVANFRDFTTMVSAFITRTETRAASEKEERERHAQEVKNSLDSANERINRNIAHRNVFWSAAGVCVAAAGLCVAILSIMASFYLAHHSIVEPVNLFHQGATHYVCGYDKAGATWH